MTTVKSEIMSMSSVNAVIKIVIILFVIIVVVVEMIYFRENDVCLYYWTKKKNIQIKCFLIFHVNMRKKLKLLINLMGELINLIVGLINPIV